MWCSGRVVPASGGIFLALGVMNRHQGSDPSHKFLVLEPGLTDASRQLITCAFECQASAAG